MSRCLDLGQIYNGHVWLMCLRNELVGDTRYADHADRTARMSEVDELVELWTRSLARSEIVERIQKEGGLRHLRYLVPGTAVSGAAFRITRPSQSNRDL